MPPTPVLDKIEGEWEGEGEECESKRYRTPSLYLTMNSMFKKLISWFILYE